MSLYLICFLLWSLSYHLTLTNESLCEALFCEAKHVENWFLLNSLNIHFVQIVNSFIVFSLSLIYQQEAAGAKVAKSVHAVEAQSVNDAMLWSQPQQLSHLKQIQKTKVLTIELTSPLLLKLVTVSF